MRDPPAGPGAGGGLGGEVGGRAVKRPRVDKQLFDDETVPVNAVQDIMGRVVQHVRKGPSPSCTFFPDRIDRAQFRFERGGDGGGKVQWFCVACSTSVATTGTSASSMQAIKRWPCVLPPVH